jgi:uncharacterized protein YceH (UPF0502 family)
MARFLEALRRRETLLHFAIVDHLVGRYLGEIVLFLRAAQAAERDIGELAYVTAPTSARSWDRAQRRLDAVGFQPVDLSVDEIRVLGCLIEKQKTTPDQYPLSLNALRLAASQSTNRDPVVEYDEPTVRAAVQELSRRGWARLATGPGSRAIKYRHLFDEEFDLRDPQLAVIAVLMLRGPQTPGELKQRTERMHRFESVGTVVETLEDLIERELAERLERRPGQKEERYRHRPPPPARTTAWPPSRSASRGSKSRSRSFSGLGSSELTERR